MFSKKIQQSNIILASKSPRRQQLLKDIGLSFTVKTKETQENYPAHLKGVEITDFLAKLKALPFEKELQEKDILLTSDTIVWSEGKALEKPKNSEEAFAMLQSLSGKKHEVITSVHIQTTNFQKTIHDTTMVLFASLSDEEINHYIKHFSPFDKAGSYGIQEWIGLIGIEKIEGSYFNVVGLPTQKLYAALQEL